MCSRAHPGAVSLMKTVMCEDCDKKRAHYWLPPKRKARWCGPCSRAHAGAVCCKMCEDCGKKQAARGLPAERKRRWCLPCARVHGATVNLKSNKKCEDCGQKQVKFGLPEEKKERWCTQCSQHHAGATVVYVYRRKDMIKDCQDCGENFARWGDPTDRQRQWCAVCSRAHAGAVDLSRKICVSCGLKPATYSMPSQPRERLWCSSCAVPHGGLHYDRIRRGAVGPAARVIPLDPDRKIPTPDRLVARVNSAWAEQELAAFRELLAQEGPGDWKGKAAKLGTGRSVKSLHARWLRDEGRIVDLPRCRETSERETLTSPAQKRMPSALVQQAPPARKRQRVADQSENRIRRTKEEIQQGLSLEEVKEMRGRGNSG